MRRTLSFVGWVAIIGSGIAMFVFWMGALQSWLGTVGTVLGIILTPGIVVFPLVYWIVEGVFPLTYFVIWGIGVGGMVITAVNRRD